MIGQRVNDDDRVFTRFDHFVEIADRAVSDGGSQRTVVPDRLLALEQEASDEVRRGQVFVASDGDERAFEPPRHVLDKTRFSAASRAFENDRQPRGVRGFKQFHLAADREVIGLS